MSVVNPQETKHESLLCSPGPVLWRWHRAPLTLVDELLSKSSLTNP